MSRPRTGPILLWLWPPVAAVAWLLNLFGVLDTGWMLGIVAATWSVSLVPVLLLVRMGRRKRNGHA